ncbi:MAG: peptide-binding protein [Spirochaetota bacterium]
MKYNVTALILVIVVLFSGCRKQASSHPAWYITSLPAEPVTLNPVTSSEAYGSAVYGHVFNSLITVDKTLTVIPDLAERWEISPDHLVYTFHLRKDVTWHDGKPFTAHDVVFTYQKIMDPLSKAMNKRADFLDVVKAEALGDHTFRATYKRAFVPALLSWGISIIPRHIFQNVDFLSNPYNRAPIGTGVYRFVEWKTGQQLTLAKVTNHFRDNPAIERIIFKVIKDDAVRLAAYKRGDIDFNSMNAEQWERAKKDASITRRSHMLEYTVLSFSYIGWNMDGSNPFFTDKRVRQAMSHALPVDAVIKSILHGHARAISGPFHPDVWAYNKAVRAYPFDMKISAALLSSAGWSDSDKDGVLDRSVNGKKIDFRFEILYGESSTEGEATLILLKENLAKIGVTLDLHKIEWSAYTKKIHSKQFTACLLGWSLSIDPDPTQLFHSREIAEGLNYYSYRNAEVDRLCDEGIREFDQAKRAAIYRRVHAVLNDECPYTFLWARNALVAIDDRFTGIELSPAGLDFYPGMLAWKIKK